MELGQKLRQARLASGLSQRQLCGDVITRNMLSQIENGSAKPSMDTLRHLAQGLGKPVSYFLEEEMPPSLNQAVMERSRRHYGEGAWQQAWEALGTYRQPDPVFDWEWALLRALTGMALAEQAIDRGRLPYGAQLLEAAGEAGRATPYYTRELEQRRLVLLSRTQTDRASSLASALPDLDGALLLRANAALETGDPARCGQYLDAAEDRQSPEWNLLRGRAHLAMTQYAPAEECLLRAQSVFPREAATALEQCCFRQEDYQGAYLWACRLRELTEGPP